MPGAAQEFVARVSAEGLPLDFTPASLAILDRMLVNAKKQLAAMPIAERNTQESWACLNMGAYVGEVLSREEGGVWTKGDDGLPLLDLGSHLAPTVTAVLGLIHDGRIEMPGGVVETLVAYYQVSNASRTWLEAAVRGSHATMERLQREMSDDGELAKSLAAQAQLAVKTAKTKWNASLDFAPGSLEAVEHVLAQLHDLLKSAAPADRPTDKQIDGAALTWGVYVGEVMRRHLGGKWAISQPDGVLQLEINDVQVFQSAKCRSVWSTALATRFPSTSTRGARASLQAEEPRRQRPDAGASWRPTGSVR